uniref:Uncharacterized protein n=1 Tax=Lotus japonicus TaxID=34305 RepID=I3SPR9_LOTJA|nr:unknown [Lotus japonicus]
MLFNQISSTQHYPLPFIGCHFRPRPFIKCFARSCNCSINIFRVTLSNMSNHLPCPGIQRWKSFTRSSINEIPIN